MNHIKNNELCYRLIDLLYESETSIADRESDLPPVIGMELLFSDLEQLWRKVDLISVKITRMSYAGHHTYNMSINGCVSWTITITRKTLFDQIKEEIEDNEMLGQVIVADESFINPLINKIQMTLQAIKL